MKFFIVFALLIVATVADLTEDHKALAKQHGGECIKQESLSEDDIKKVRARDFSDPSDSIKCFANCFLEKAKLIENGAIDKDLILKTLTPIFGEERVKELIQKCGDVKGSDKCSTAFELYKCYHTVKAPWNVEV